MAKRQKKQKKQRASAPKQTRPGTRAAGTYRKRSGHHPDDVGAALSLAAQYLADRKEKEIPAVLQPLESVYPFEDAESCRLFNILLAFGCVHTGQFAEAERIISRGLELQADSLDLNYVLSYAKLSLREYDETIKAGEAYLAKYDQVSSSSQQADCTFATTSGHLSQLCNFMATAYREQRDHASAKKCYQKAIDADPGNHLPYLNLANLLRLGGEFEPAAEVLGRGIEHCRQVQELRMLQNSFRHGATISACMIVKNEEQLLPDCLESIRNWVNEIIVVDTGSTDSTVQIAESYGARIFHQAWEGDFSKHRNYSIEQATSDWIFIIDADEQMCSEDVPALLDVANRADVSIISINVYNVYGQNEQTRTFLPSVRLFRRELDLRYNGIVHNRLEFPASMSVTRVPVQLKHLGYDLSREKMEAKFLRTKALLEKQLEENPDNFFALFNHAQLLRGEGTEFPVKNAGEIIKTASRAVELTDPDNIEQRHIHLMCLDQIAWAYFYTGQHEKALEYCRTALQIKPNYLDPLLLVGHVYSRQGQYELGKEHYQHYLETQAKFDDTRETDNIILLHPDSRSCVFYGLAVIAELTGEPEKAEDLYRRTLDIDPGFQEANTHLGRLLRQDGSISEAETCFRNQIEKSRPTYDAAVSLADIYHQRNETEQTEKYYRLALKISPDGVQASLGLGRLCFETNRPDEGVELFRKLKERGSAGLSNEKQLAKTYYDMGRYEDAAGAYDDVIRKTEPDSDLLNDLGNCFFKMQQYDRAEEYYTRATDVIPVNSTAFFNLGLTRARANRPKEAIVALEKYLEVDSGNTEIHRIVGGLHFELGDFGAAIENFEQILSINPRDLEALFGLSECYLHMGHRDSAILGYRQALAIAPEFEPAQTRLNEVEAVAEKAGE